MAGQSPGLGGRQMWEAAFKWKRREGEGEGEEEGRREGKGETGFKLEVVKNFWQGGSFD